MGRKRIAIACQGGGTHAAFTWGVLTTILKTKKLWDARSEEGDTFDIVSISGTSAGALCALATWYGLVPNAADPECGTIDKAIERLDSLWTGFAATTPVEIAHNTIATTLLDWKARGVPFPGSNPNDAYGTIGLAGLSMMGAPGHSTWSFRLCSRRYVRTSRRSTGRRWRRSICGLWSAPSKFSAAISKSSIPTKLFRKRV